MVGRQTPFLALIVPLILVGMVDGAPRHPPDLARRGRRRHLVRDRPVRVLELHLRRADRHRRLAALRRRASSRFLQVWQPSEPLRGEVQGGGPRPAIAGAAVDDAAHRARGAAQGGQRTRLAARDVRGLRAVHHHHRRLRDRKLVDPVERFLFKDFLGPASARQATVRLAGPRRRDTRGRAAVVGDVPVSFWANAAGTLLLVCGPADMLVLRFSLGTRAAHLRRDARPAQVGDPHRRPVLALAYVMNLSGRRSRSAAGSPARRGCSPFLSSIIGWLGVAVTGSDTSSNSLFGALQVAAAKEAGLLRRRCWRRRTRSGGVLGKMISPQNLAIGAAAVGLAGKEGEHLPAGAGLEHRCWCLSCASSCTCSRPRYLTGWWSRRSERRAGTGADPDGPDAARRRAARGRRGQVGLHAGAPAADLRVGRAAPVQGHPRRGGAAGQRGGGPGGRARVRGRRRAVRGARRGLRACPAARCRSPTGS